MTTLKIWTLTINLQSLTSPSIRTNFPIKALKMGAFILFCHFLIACSPQTSPEEVQPKSLKASKIHYQMGLQLEEQEDFVESQKQYRYALAYLQELGLDSVSKDSSLMLYLDSVLLGMESNWIQSRGEEVEDTVGLWMSDFEDIVLDSQETKVIKGLSDSIDIHRFSIPIVLNERVFEELHYLSQRVPSFMRKSLSRKTMYEDLIYRELDSMNVPRDLIYQALVESGYKTSALSSASAGGIWQFIPSTGRAYGMKIDWWVDERRDPLKSTRAAIEFMKDLYKQFGDWHLAMAAYNCGGGRVRRAIREAGTNNYWELDLPKETQHYVPRIIAAAIIGHYPERYGIEVTPMEHPKWEESPVSHCIPLSTIATLIGVSEDTLRILNPELRQWCTPSDTKNYALKIPEGKKALWEVEYAKMDKSKLKRLHRHIVQSGEYLGKISSKYGISVSDIQSANNLKSSRLSIGQVLIIPLPAELGEKLFKAESSNEFGYKVYKVKRGDNLYTISRKLSVSLQTLLEVNNLNARQSIKVGQKLKYPYKIPKAAPVATRTWKSSELENYLVKSGDNYFLIAQTFGITSTELMAINQAANSNLNVGQVLKVPKSTAMKPTSSSAKSAGEASLKTNSKTSPKVTNLKSNSKTYTIARGDNLYNISQKFGVSLKDLMAINDFQSGVKIQPGQKIQIPTRQNESAKNTSTASSDKKTNVMVQAGIVWYTVQSGDTLWDISKTHQVSVEELKEWNQLDKRPIMPGMKIKIGEQK